MPIGNAKLLADSFGDSCSAVGNGDLPYVVLIVFSPLLIFILTWTVRRQKGGRPGCPTAVPVIDPCHNRWLHAAFWGMVSFEAVQFFQDPDGLIISTCVASESESYWEKPLIVLSNVLLYAFLYYPILVGFSTDTFIGDFIASGWTWAIAILRGAEIYDIASTEKDVGEQISEVFKNFLPLVFVLLLSLYFPYRMVKCLVTRPTDCWNPSPKEADFKMTPEGRYVSCLLRSQKPLSSKDHFIPLHKRIIEAIIYRRKSYFRFSQTITSTVTISFVFLYYILFVYFRGVFYLVPNYRFLTHNITSAILHYLNMNETERSIEIVDAYFDSFSNSLIASGVFVSILQLVLLLTLFPVYRGDMISAYRGRYTKVAPPASSTPLLIFDNAVSYMGHQTIMFSWGCVVQLILFSVFFLLIAWFIVVPLTYNVNLGVFHWLLNILPAVGVTIGLMLVQLAIVAVFFVQDCGRNMNVKNRRFYSHLAYIAFFKNLIVSFFGAVFRIVLSMIFGGILFSRVDFPILNRRLEQLDASFSVYCGLIHLEKHYLNPCVVTFANILLWEGHKSRRLLAMSSHGCRGESTLPSYTQPAASPFNETNLESGMESMDTTVLPHDTENLIVRIPEPPPRTSYQGQSDGPGLLSPRRDRLMQFKWRLAYTLVRNPNLIAERKAVLGINLI